MARYLITQSLLSSWLYQFTAEDYEGAREDFLRTLCREPGEQTEAMRNGIEFENNVYSVVHSQSRAPHPSWESGIQLVATELRGSQTQVRVSRELERGGDTFLVYGILDALRAGVIYDVKFSNRSFGSVELAGKYLGSPQHPAYFYCVPEAYEFRYLVSDGSDLYIETYHPSECESIGAIIDEFAYTLREENLLDLYRQYWVAR